MDDNGVRSDDDENSNKEDDEAITRQQAIDTLLEDVTIIRTKFMFLAEEAERIGKEEEEEYDDDERKGGMNDIYRQVKQYSVHAVKCLSLIPPIGETSFMLKNVASDNDDGGDEGEEIKEHQHLQKAFARALGKVTRVCLDLENVYTDDEIEQRQEKIIDIRKIQNIIAQSLDTVKEFWNARDVP